MRVCFTTQAGVDSRQKRSCSAASLRPSTCCGDPRLSGKGVSIAPDKFACRVDGFQGNHHSPCMLDQRGFPFHCASNPYFAQSRVRSPWRAWRARSTSSLILDGLVHASEPRQLSSTSLSQHHRRRRTRSRHSPLRGWSGRRDRPRSQ